MKHVQDMDIYKEYLDKVEEGNNKSYKRNSYIKYG